MDDKMQNDEVEFVGVIDIDSETIVIGDPTKPIDKGVLIRDFGGNGVYPVFIIRDDRGNIVGATINFDIDSALDNELELEE